MFWDQSDYDVRCEWGEQGLAALREGADVIVLVDVLSFCTSVDVICANGGIVYPFPRVDASAVAFAREKRAFLAADVGGSGGYTSRPATFLQTPPKTRLVLPSVNGSALSLQTTRPTLAGCLRNARAVAAAAQRIGPKIALIAAGERWADGRSLRPAIEDWIGCGAIIAHLSGTRSPEAQAALAVYESVARRLPETVFDCISGRELQERGDDDMIPASQHNVSNAVPMLRDGAYVNAELSLIYFRCRRGRRCRPSHSHTPT